MRENRKEGTKKSGKTDGKKGTDRNGIEHSLSVDVWCNTFVFIIRLSHDIISSPCI